MEKISSREQENKIESNNETKVDEEIIDNFIIPEGYSIEHAAKDIYLLILAVDELRAYMTEIYRRNKELKDEIDGNKKLIISKTIPEI